MNPALVGLAIAPGLAIMIYIYWKDKFEKEPKHWLIWAFFLGIISIVPAIFFETIWQEFGFKASANLYRTIFYAFVVVGFSEEFSKWFFLRYLLYPKSVFNEPYDGITYSVMISMGFATTENIMYVMDGGISTAIMRMFTAVPAHAAFAVIMGYFVGLAKFNPSRKFLYMMLALLFSTLLHGAYDFSLMQEKIPHLKFMGAILSLYIGIKLSKSAIKIHQKNSPFRTFD